MVLFEKAAREQEKSWEISPSLDVPGDLNPNR